MRFKAGAKLRPYEIEEPLGAGGMGEVFRAPSRTMTEGVFAAFQAAWFACVVGAAAGMWQLGPRVMLLVVVVLAKILALSLSLVTGFIGGPVMPSLFIGGISGPSIEIVQRLMRCFSESTDTLLGELKASV